MARPFTREEFETPRGRCRAQRELLLADHGFLRAVYDNTHEVAPGKIWRTYQPSPRKLEKWKQRGVKTVLNLRGATMSGVYLLEEDACKKLGLTLVPFRVYSREAPAKETLHGARRLFKDIEYPAVMHCKSGADRVGLMSVLYLFFEEGVRLDQAMKHLSFRYGHVKQGKTGVIDFALNQYIEYAAAQGKSLSSIDDFFEWVDGPYDPAAAKAAFKSGFLGDVLTEKILRRE